MITRVTPSITNILQRKLIFVSGKGGVGKSAVSRGIAIAGSQKGLRTLWVTFEDPIYPRGKTTELRPLLWHINCDAMESFEEYAALKIGANPLTRLFIHNKVVRYLAQAAPGIHELVLLGKVWHLLASFDSIVVDMPATGHGLAMFQSTKNFSRLFKGGPIHHDAESMLASFADPKITGQLIVALPEEMPLRESLELGDFLTDLFPANPPAFLVNRLFPKAEAKPEDGESPDTWPTPVPRSAADYAIKRSALEEFNLRIWREHGFDFASLDFVPPHAQTSLDSVSRGIAVALQNRSYL